MAEWPEESQTWTWFGVRDKGPDGAIHVAEYGTDEVAAQQAATMPVQPGESIELVRWTVTYGPAEVIPNPLLEGGGAPS